MRVHLEYGRDGLDVELPDDRVVRSLAYKQAPPLANPQAAVRDLIRQPTGTGSLAELARGRSDSDAAARDPSAGGYTR